MVSHLSNVLFRPWVWFFVPFLLLAAAVWPRFDGLYGQDAYAYYNYAIGDLRDFLITGESFPVFFWPPGYPLLVTLTSFLVGPTPLAGQIVSLAAAILIPFSTYLLAKELRPHDKHTPYLAGILVAFTGQLWQSSIVVMSDTTALALGTLGVWAVARYGHTGRGRWLIFAAAALAYALLTRWAFGLVALPATLYALYITLVKARNTQQPTVNSTQLPLTQHQPPRSHILILLFAAAITVLLILSPVLYAILTQEREPRTSHISFTGDLGVVSWHPLTAFQREFVTADGLLSYRWPTGLFYPLTSAYLVYFTPFLAWLILPGFWVIIRERAAAALFLVCGWAGIAIVFLMGIGYQNFRFSLVYLPPLAIAAALGLTTLWSQLRSSKHPPHSSPIPLLAFIFLISIGGITMTFNGGRLVNTFITNKNHDLATVAWVTQQTEPDSNLICLGLTLTFQQYSSLHTHEIFYLETTDIPPLLAAERPTYLLLDVNNVEKQWAERPPGTNFRWLQQQAQLTPIGQNGAFTLYRVRP